MAHNVRRYGGVAGCRLPCRNGKRRAANDRPYRRVIPSAARNPYPPSPVALSAQGNNGAQCAPLRRGCRLPVACCLLPRPCGERGTGNPSPTSGPDAYCLLPVAYLTIRLTSLLGTAMTLKTLPPARATAFCTHSSAWVKAASSSLERSAGAWMVPLVLPLIWMAMVSS